MTCNALRMTSSSRMQGSEIDLAEFREGLSYLSGLTEAAESVCLPQRLYHKFWGQEGNGTVLVGEVNRVNDDRVDNHFFEPVGRFPTVEEDESPLHLLMGDYGRYYRSALK